MTQKLFRDPPFSHKTLIQIAKGAFFGSFLFALLILVNLIQTLSLVILPFSRRAFRNTNRFLANFWWGTCVVSIERVNGTRLVVTGHPIPKGENAVLIANHQQMPDIVAIMMYAKTKDRLGDLKWFVKDIIKYVPGIGWGMVFLDCLYVKRRWDADKDKIESIFSKFLKDQIPIWLISFVEGTRITRGKLEKSQNYARANGLPVFENVLIPRTKGFVASIQGLRGHVRIVYDITIGYPKGIPSLWQLIKGNAKEIHFHIERYELDSLPVDPVALSSWLMSRFLKKDKLLVDFHQQGSFASSSSPALGKSDSTIFCSPT